MISVLLCLCRTLKPTVSILLSPRYLMSRCQEAAAEASATPSSLRTGSSERRCPPSRVRVEGRLLGRAAMPEGRAVTEERLVLSLLHLLLIQVRRYKPHLKRTQLHYEENKRCGWILQIKYSYFNKELYHTKFRYFKSQHISHFNSMRNYVQPFNWHCLSFFASLQIILRVSFFRN